MRSACRLLGCVFRVPGLKCGRCMPYTCRSAFMPFAVLQRFRTTSTIMKLSHKPPEVASFPLNTLVHGDGSEKKVCVLKLDIARCQGIPRGHRPVHVPKHLAWEPEIRVHPDGIRLGTHRESKDASPRRRELLEFRSVCDRASGSGVEKGNRKRSIFLASPYLREEEEQRTFTVFAADDPQKVANETERKRKTERQRRMHEPIPEVGKWASGGAFAFLLQRRHPE